ncbi:MAG TPA: hypothetical protein VF212_07035 [Longimicrobiales bacterium]
MPWIVTGLLVALASWIALRIARRTERQLMASLALWGIWVGLAIAAVGLAALALWVVGFGR